MYTILNDRAVISIAGEDRFKFLQGLITNDVEKLHDTKAIYACMLTPQGKYFADIFLLNQLDKLLLDIPVARKDDLLKKLNIYKLRSHIIITDIPEYKVISLQAEAIAHDNSFIDPRNAVLGRRGMIHQDDLPLIIKGLNEDKNAYDLIRIKNFIPEGEKDLVSDKSFLLEYGFDQLNAIDYKKGCYVGQELIARTHYTGVIRKEIVQIKSNAENLPELGTEIHAGEQKLGIVCSSIGKIGLGLIRTENMGNLNENEIIKAADVAIELIFKEKIDD